MVLSVTASKAGTRADMRAFLYGKQALLWASSYNWVWEVSTLEYRWKQMAHAPKNQASSICLGIVDVKQEEACVWTSVSVHAILHAELIRQTIFEMHTQSQRTKKEVMLQLGCGIWICVLLLHFDDFFFATFCLLQKTYAIHTKAEHFSTVSFLSLTLGDNSG